MNGAADEQLADLAEWTTSSDARRAAQHELRNRGLLGVAVDDLCSQTYLQVAARIRRRGPVELASGKTIAGYARAAMPNIVSSMMRGRQVDAFGHIGKAQKPDEIDPLENLPDRPERELDENVVAKLAADDTIDSVRSHLLATMDPTVWAASAALTVVTLAVDPERDHEIGPRPDAGASGQWRYWTGLWLAGEKDCFADRKWNRAGDAARRKRRSRAINLVQQRLEAAHVAASSELSST